MLCLLYFTKTRLLALSAFALQILAGSFAFSSSAQAQSLHHMTVGEHGVFVEIADTASKRLQGLMHRKSLPVRQGMFFVFSHEQRLCFWMKNTFIPLTIAFIDRNYQIVDIHDMQALDTQTYCTKINAKYALEMNQGWFKERGITVGDKINFSTSASKE